MTLTFDEPRIHHDGYSYRFERTEKGDSNACSQASPGPRAGAALLCAIDGESTVIRSGVGWRVAMKGRRAAAVTMQGPANVLPGTVVTVERGDLLARVELQCGSQRVIAVISRETADVLRLGPGVSARAVIAPVDISLIRA